MFERNDNPIPPFDLFPRLARAGRFMLRVVRQLPESGYYSDHGHESQPEDTLASQPHLFTPDWVADARTPNPDEAA